MAASELALCDVDTLDVGNNDIMGNFAWGFIALTANDTQTAERKFKQVIALDKTNPLAFHWLGSLLYKQKRWEEAAIIFNYAIAYHLQDAEFKNYCDLLT